MNLSLLAQAVGGRGQVYAVDLSEGMSPEARDQSLKENWRNVTLIRSDATEYTLPGDLFCFKEYDSRKVIAVPGRIIARRQFLQ